MNDMGPAGADDPGFSRRTFLGGVAAAGAVVGLAEIGRAHV